MSRLKFDNDGNNKKDKIEVICNNVVFFIEFRRGHLPKLYYLVSWKGYFKEKNIKKPISTIQHLQKLVTTLHKDHLKKPMETLPPINTTSSMTRLTVKAKTSTIKQKRGQPAKANNVNKHVKKS